jgi:hypothetical protein
MSQHHLQPRLLRRLARIRRGARQPPLDLLKANRVLRSRVADFDVQHRRGTDTLEPGVFPENFHRKARRFVEALGLHFRSVTDAAMVLVGTSQDRAGMAKNVAYSFFLRPYGPKK